MPHIVTEGLAGYGLLSIGATLLLALMLCDEAVRWRKWRQWYRRVQQTEPPVKCEWCDFTGPEDKVWDHEMEDHVQLKAGG